MSKNWIADATKNKGALHRQMGVPEGEKIPAKKLAKAADKGGVMGKRARLAETLKGFHHGMQMGPSGYGLTHGDLGDPAPLPKEDDIRSETPVGAYYRDEKGRMHKRRGNYKDGPSFQPDIGKPKKTAFPTWVRKQHTFMGVTHGMDESAEDNTHEFRGGGGSRL